MRDRVRTVARAGALLVGVVLASLLLALAVVRLPMIQRWAADEVEARLPAGVTIERAALTVLPPGVRLTGVSLAAGGPSVASVLCRLRVPALLAGRAEVSAVIVDGASMSIERGADGDIAMSGPVAGILATTSEAKTGAPAPAAVQLSTLPSLTMRTATLTFVDHAGHGGPHTLQFSEIHATLGPAVAGVLPISLGAHFDTAGVINADGSVHEVAAADGHGTGYAIDFSATASSLDANTVLSYLAAVIPGGGSAHAQGEVDGSLSIAGTVGAELTGKASLTQSTGSAVWDDVALAAPLSLSAQFKAADGAIAISQGQLGVAQVAANPVIAQALAAGFTYADGVLQLTSARASAFGGTWSQTGSVTLSDPPRFDITMRADHVGCAALLSVVTGEQPQFGCDRLSAEAAVHGPWTGAGTVAESAEGNGRIDMQGGTIPSSSIIGAMWDAIVPRAGLSRQRRGMGAPTRIAKLTESFVLRGGRMHTSDLSLVTDDYTVTGSGNIGLNGSLDLDTEVALSPGGVAKLLTMAALPIPSEVPHLPPIRTRISGTIGSPTIRPQVEQLPFTLVRGLFGGAIGAGQVMTEAAGKGLRGLRDELKGLW
jgi:hypothetical protein